MRKWPLIFGIIIALFVIFLTAEFFTIQKSAPVMGVTSAEATEKVKNLPDVQEWLSLFSGLNHISPATGGRPIIEVDSISDDSYIIHAYEQTFDHMATFGWYSVNKKTGVVKKEI